VNSYWASIGLSDRSVDQLPLIHVTSEGYRRAEGVEISLTWGQPGYDPLAGLLAGRTAFALLDVPTIAQAAERKLGLVGVFQLYATDLSRVFSLERTGVRTVADLIGRPIGLRSPKGSPAEALRACLRQIRAQPDDVELILSTTSLRELLETSEVAALSASEHLIPWFEARGLQVVRLPRGGWEIVPGLVLATTRSYLTDNRIEVTRLVSALRSGLLATVEDPASLQSTATTFFSPPPDQRPALAAQVDGVLSSLHAFAADHGPGWADADRYEAASGLLRDLGTLSGSIKLSQVFINDFLPTSSTV